MYDINFYKKSYPLKQDITEGKLSLKEVQNIEKELENLRNKAPTIFNIETTNYCNMKCVFCARTIFMERKNIWINDDLFEKMLDQVVVHDHKKLNDFGIGLKKMQNLTPMKYLKMVFIFQLFQDV